VRAGLAKPSESPPVAQARRANTERGHGVAERVLRSGPHGRPRECALPFFPSGAPMLSWVFCIIIFNMFFLKKIIAAFVLPPGCLVLALAGLAFYLRKRSRPAALACAALSGLVWTGSAKVFSDALMRPLEYAYSVPAEPAGDVIVILCGGSRGGGEFFSASENLASGTLERVSAAFLLYKKTGLPLLVSGGALFSEVPEAAAAAAYLRELGVPEEKILTEGASRDTKENAAFSRRICAEKDYNNIILLTSAYHMPRSVLLFNKAGFAYVAPFPVGRDAVAGGGYSFRDWLPGRRGETARAMNEYLGLLTYKLYYSFI